MAAPGRSAYSCGRLRDGSLPTGLVLVRLLKGEDIRRHGSGNIGTVNVFRVAGTPTAVAVLAVDIVKGLVPVLLAVRVETITPFPRWS